MGELKLKRIISEKNYTVHDELDNVRLEHKKVGRPLGSGSLEDSKKFSKKELVLTSKFMQLGATQEELADLFMVDASTIERWISVSGLFRKAVYEGSIMADIKVSQALFSRAVGFEYEEAQLVIIKGEAQQISIKKKVLPDVRAQMFWLSNRRRAEWAGSTAKVQHTGVVGHLHKNAEEVPVDELGKDAQKFLFEITQKQINNGDHGTGSIED